jgi:hypothetical protein
MTTLYKLTQEMQALDELLATCEDPNAPEIFDAIQRALALQDERERKVDAYCSLIAEINARGAARKAEAERLYLSAQVSENAVKRLKNSLLESFKTLGIKKLETERFTVTVANNGGVLPLELAPNLDPRELPEPFKKIIVAPDNEKIRAALEAKQELPFAKLGERGQHVRIK